MGLGMVSLGQFIFPTGIVEGPGWQKLGLPLTCLARRWPWSGENWYWTRGVMRPLERYVALVAIGQVSSRIRARGARVGPGEQLLRVPTVSGSFGKEPRPALVHSYVHNSVALNAIGTALCCTAFPPV